MAGRGGRERDPVLEKWWRRQALTRRDRETSATTQIDRDGEPSAVAPAFRPV